MFNLNNQQNQSDKNNSIFEVLDNDLFVNFLFDQPQLQFRYYFQFRNINTMNRSTSNQQLSTLMSQNYQGQYMGFPMSIEQNQSDLNQNWTFNDQQFGQQNLNQLAKEEIDYNPLQEFKKDDGEEKLLKQNQKLPSNDINVIKNSELFNYKNNLKNTYINKIQTLMNQDVKFQQKNSRQNKQQTKFKQQISMRTENTSISVEPKIDDDFLKDDNDENNNAKLLRNRECARNSRKRKKVYIELLESKVKSLSEELDKTKRILQTSSSYFTKISQDQQLQGFFLGRQQLYEKLDKVVQQGKDQTEINLLLDSMRFRVGGGGKERVNAANYFYHQILDICFPIHVRYLLWSSSKNKDLFYEPEVGKLPDDNESQWCTWSLDLMKSIVMTDNQKKQILKSKKKLINEKLKLEELLLKFSEIKEQLYLKTSHVENFVDELRNILTPTQTAKFLIGLERNKYRREMNLAKIWDIFDTNSDMDMDVKEENQPDQVEDPSKKIHL